MPRALRLIPPSWRRRDFEVVREILPVTSRIGGGNEAEVHPPVAKVRRTGDEVRPGERGGDDHVSNNPGPQLDVEMRLRGRAAYWMPVGGAVVPGRLPAARSDETGRKVVERRSPVPYPSARPWGPRRGGPAEGSIEGPAEGPTEEAAWPDYGPVELAAALRETMAPIGAGGPQIGGLIRIRRVARFRRLRRLIMACGLGVLLAAATLSAAAGGDGGSPAPRGGGAGGFDKRETVHRAAQLK